MQHSLLQGRVAGFQAVAVEQAHQPLLYGMAGQHLLVAHVQGDVVIIHRNGLQGFPPVRRENYQVTLCCVLRINIGSSFDGYF